MSFNSYARLLRCPALFRRSVPAPFSASCGPYLRPTRPTILPWIRFARPGASIPPWPLPPVIPVLPAPVPPRPSNDSSTPQAVCPLPSSAGDLRCLVPWCPCRWPTVRPLVGVLSGPLRPFAPIPVGLMRCPIAALPVVFSVLGFPCSARLAPLRYRNMAASHIPTALPSMQRMAADLLQQSR